MKKVLSLVISCLIIIGCIPVCAKETEQNYSDFIVVENEDDVTITKVTQSNLVSVIIPGEINGKKVKLSSHLFEGMESLESIIIEEGVVEIPENAFHKCINLKTVKLPNTLESIDEWAFRESGLNEIDLPNRVISIGNSAFNGTKITNVRIPEKVTILSNYTFSGCEQLTFVDLNNVEVVRQGAFSECIKLEKVVHSGNLIELETVAFENCPVLNEIDVKNVKAFGSRVFYGNEKIEYMNLQSVEEAVMVKDDYIQGEENLYFVGEWYIKGGGVSSPLSFSSFSGMMALKTVRVNLANFKTKGIGVLFFRTPQLDTIIYENFSPEVTGKWLCHEYDLTKPRNANLVLYGNEDVKAYAESIGVPFKELIDVNLNGERIRMDDCLPYIKNDRTLVPMRAIFEALGAEVSWDDTTKTAVGVKDGVEVKITIGENVLYKNGEAIELDAPAEITNDRTMVPVRAISEAFGCTVNWDNDTKTVEITN